MSFGDRAFGGALDYGDLLPRRGRRILAWAFLALMLLAPKTYIGLVTRYAQERAQGIVEVIVDALPQPTTPTTAP